MLKTTLALVFGATLASCSSDDAKAPAGPVETIDPFCASRPKLQFCEDFDTAELPSQFAEKTETAAKLQLDTRDPESPPRILFAEAYVGAPRAILSRTFDTPGKKFKLFFQAKKLGAAAPDQSVEIAALEYPAIAYRVSVELKNGLPTVFETVGGAAPKALSGVIPFPEDWVSFRFDIVFEEDGSGTATVRFGTEVAVEAPLMPPAEAASPTLSLGIAASKPGPAGWGYFFDNVTFQVE